MLFYKIIYLESLRYDYSFASVSCSNEANSSTKKLAISMDEDIFCFMLMVLFRMGKGFSY